MLTGIHPLLSGDLLRLLDHMGHGDTVLIADAHYPSYATAAPVIDVHTTSPEMLRAVRSVVPFDDYEGPSITLMTPEPGEGEEVGAQLRDAARAPDGRIDAVERFAFYELASTAFAIVRTAETRKYGCVLLRKGVVGFGD